MVRGTIFFAHANGFPAGTYRKIFKSLSDDFDVDFTPLLGHDPNLPPNDNWTNIKTELHREIASRHSGPVIGVGHSLGGVLHLLVAADHPELYSHIVLVEAPIISRFSSHSLRVMKAAGLIDRLSPSQTTRYRRSVWRSREEVHAHFKAKPKFAAFDPEVLDDYVNSGTVLTEKGFELVFRPQIEARIYRTIPHDLPALRRRISTPLSYIGGSDSREGRMARLGFMRRFFDIDFTTVEGTHLFPMEYPERAALAIKDSIFQKKIKLS